MTKKPKQPKPERPTSITHCAGCDAKIEIFATQALNRPTKLVKCGDVAVTVGVDCGCYARIEAAGETGIEPRKREGYDSLAGKGPLVLLTEQEHEAMFAPLIEVLAREAARLEWARVEQARSMPRPDECVHLYDEERGTACGLAVSSMWPELREALLIERDERIGLTKDPNEVTCLDCRVGPRPPRG